MTKLKQHILLAVSGIVVAAGVAMAQPPGGQGEFLPLNQLRPTEQMPAAPLLIAAYAFVWVAVTCYLWSIRRRLEKVEADMHALARRSRHAEQSR